MAVSLEVSCRPQNPHYLDMVFPLVCLSSKVLGSPVGLGHSIGVRNKKKNYIPHPSFVN